MNFLLRFAIGLFCGAGLGFAGFALVSFAMFFIAPAVLIFNQYWDFLSNRIIYRPHKEQEKEIRMAKKVRKSDPLFSIQSFLGGIQNKLSMPFILQIQRTRSTPFPIVIFPIVSGNIKISLILIPYPYLWILTKKRRYPKGNGKRNFSTQGI